MDDLDDDGTADTPATGRRSFIKKAAVGAGVAWVAPVVLSQSGAAAASGTSKTTSLPIGGPPTDVGCGFARILPGQGAGQFDLYATQGQFNVAAITPNGGGSITSISPTLPHFTTNAPPITIATSGTITGFNVTVTC